MDCSGTREVVHNRGICMKDALDEEEDVARKLRASTIMDFDRLAISRNHLVVLVPKLTLGAVKMPTHDTDIK